MVLLRPLHWLEDQLKRPVRLERRGFQLHLVLKESEHSRPQVAPERQGHEPVREVRRELKRLLDQHASTRALMRHLVYVESQMRRGMPPSKLPLAVRLKALEQLTVLASQATPGPLALLHEWLGAGGSASDGQLPANAQDRPAGDDASSAVQVSEGSDTDFQEVHQRWANTLPTGPTPPAQAEAEPDNEPGGLKLVPMTPAEPAQSTKK